MVTQKRGKDDRRRCWACVVYPESAPADWLDTVATWGIPAAVSPLHDKDKDPDGREKKPHYHIIVKFAGKKSADQVASLFDEIRGVGCIKIESPEGYTRYLVHKDNPDKAQYRTEDIKAFGGYDVMSALCNNADKTQTIREMQAYCEAQNITNFADLMDYAMENNPSWYVALCTYCSALMVRYLKAREDRVVGALKRKLQLESVKYNAAKARQKQDLETWERDRRKMAQWYEYRRQFAAWLRDTQGIDIEGG